MKFLKCNACGKEVNEDEFVVLSVEKTDGNSISIICFDCAENSPKYCEKHKRHHLGFMDGSTACLSCIEETIAQKESEGFNVWGLFKKKLPAKEVFWLLDWADFSALITGNSKERCILWAVVTKALRNNQKIVEVIREVLERKSVSSILPPNFLIKQ